ncbi:MAG: GNAT family N-acetyltransferase, partial [Planctomycetes bacterium]|nr:GNAT family N-acetyltransferase [Planctomycetota bacterium]
MIVAKPDWPAMKGKLETLFRASFDRPIPLGYLDWRYFDNSQEQLLFAVEIPDHDPVASYSAFPVDLISDGKTCRTAMSMTTMTHPHWRGKGLFQKLAAELY